MPSEEHIRAEVHRVADSVDVATDEHLAHLLARSREHRRRQGGAPATGRGRRGLVPILAAASVAGVVVLGTGLTGVLSRGGPDVAPEVRPEVDGAARVLTTGTPEGTVPSVFGHTRASARVLLEERGLEVRFGEEVSCEPAGRPIGTVPTTGTRARPGQTVTVVLAYQGPSTDCVADKREPWRFVDFATGRGAAPSFAEDVKLYVDGASTGTLSGPDVARGDWGSGSPLDILARAVESVGFDGSSYLVPTLEVVTGTPPERWCGVTRPAAAGVREALILSIAVPEPGRQQCPARVALYDSGGRIDTVVAWSGGAGDDAPAEVRQTIPDVVGLRLAEARATVSAAGYSVRVEEIPSCRPRPEVIEQAPTHGASTEDTEDAAGSDQLVTLVVEVAHTERPCGDLDTAAKAFLRFARGGEPPDWAPEVHQLLGYTPWASVTAGRADDPAAWAFCSGVSAEQCTVSPLVVASRGDVETGEFADLTRWPDDDGCELIDRGGLSVDVSPERQIVLYPARLPSCDDEWTISLWVDDQGRITTVNLLVPA